LRRVAELLLLALSSLRRTPLRVTLTSVGVAIATGALVSMVGFAFGVQAQVEEPFQKMELVNRIDVRPRRESPPSPAKPMLDLAHARGSPLLDDQALGRIASLPGVVIAYPDIHLESVQLLHDDKSKTGPAIGLPSQATRLRFVNDSLVAGQFFGPSSSKEIVLGLRLAQELGFEPPGDAIGRKLVLQVKGLTPTGDGKFRHEQRQIEVVVVGVWNPPAGRHGYASEGCVLPLEFMKDLPGTRVESVLGGLWHTATDAGGGYARLVVRVERPSDLFVVEKRIREMGFETQMLLSQFKEMQTGFILMDLILTAVGMVALVVAGLGIINTMLMAVLERYREIGVYKALGASASDIRILFLGEAVLVGLLGGAGGLVLGRVVSWIIGIVVNALARRQGMDHPIVAFAFPLHLLGGAVLFALLVSLLSGVYPAVRAARIDPIRALRAE
jgi:putative ABC transport system permease protein